MAKRKKKISNRMKTARKFAAAALVAPLSLTGPAAIQAFAEQPGFDQWVHQQLGGELKVGDAVTLDLGGYFGHDAVFDFTIVNHNPGVAHITLVGGVMTISGKASGSTAVDVWVHPEPGATDVLRTERFRLEIAWPDGLNNPRLDAPFDVRNVVSYVEQYPDTAARTMDHVQLLNHIPSVLNVDNRVPQAEQSPLYLDVALGDTAVVDLRDFFFDPENDDLEYSVSYDSPDIEVQQDEHIVQIKGLFSTGEASIHVMVFAQDNLSGGSAAKSVIVRVVSEDNQAPEALYEHLSLTIYDSMLSYFEVDATQLFHDQDGDEFTVISDGDDEDNTWIFEGNEISLSDNGIVKGMYSGGVTDATTVDVSLRAIENGTEPLSSEPVSIEFIVLPEEWMPSMPTVEPGEEVDLQKWFSNVFGPYELNGELVDFDFEMVGDVSSYEWLTGDDVLYVKHDAELGPQNIQINVASKDGIIRFNSLGLPLYIGYP